MFEIVWYVFASIGFLSLITYLLPVIYASVFLREQNLKKVYGAEWALVTGGSSGIGKKIAMKLASQGINVVVVALPDQLLKDSIVELEHKFPKVQFRSVGVNLGQTDPKDYLDAIKEVTKDIEVRLLFNNAGYIFPGIFSKQMLSKILCNYNCNATSAIVITHEFVNNMLKLSRNEKGKRGLVTFTSSSAGFLPGPIASLYGATKCFLTNFSASIGVELKEDGIDVVCVHPSPIDSNFYQNAKGISMLTSFQKTASGPEVIADVLFKSAGHTIIADQGYFTIGSKILLKIIDWNLISEIAPYFITSNEDFRKLKMSQ